MFGMYIIFGVILLLFILKEFFLDLGEEKKRKPKIDSKYTRVIYENPVVSALIMNITVLLISMYALKNDIPYMPFIVFFTGIGTRKLLDTSVNLTKTKKLIILLIFLAMICCFISYSTYIRTMETRKILKSLQ